MSDSLVSENCSEQKSFKTASNGVALLPQTLELFSHRICIPRRGASFVSGAWGGRPLCPPSGPVLITPKLLDDEKGGRKITKKDNMYSRVNKPKIQIPLNEHGQPIGPDATEFANLLILW
jgi:hypothetical protein